MPVSLGSLAGVSCLFPLGLCHTSLSSHTGGCPLPCGAETQHPLARPYAHLRPPQGGVCDFFEGVPLASLPAPHTPVR